MKCFDNYKLHFSVDVFETEVKIYYIYIEKAKITPNKYFLLKSTEDFPFCICE